MQHPARHTPNAAAVRRPSRRTGSVLAAATLAVLAVVLPADAAGQGRRDGRIPPGHLPAPGECRVWLDGVPPGRQPRPTSCAQARYDAARTGGRLVVGDDGWRRRDDRWEQDRRRDGDWELGRRRDDRERDRRRGDPWGLTVDGERRRDDELRRVDRRRDKDARKAERRWQKEARRAERRRDRDDR